MAFFMALSIYKEKYYAYSRYCLYYNLNLFILYDINKFKISPNIT